MLLLHKIGVASTQIQHIFRYVQCGILLPHRFPALQPNSPESRGTSTRPIRATPPPAMSCLIPCDLAPGLSFPYPSRRLIAPHMARPAPRAITRVWRTSTAELKKSILYMPGSCAGPGVSFLRNVSCNDPSGSFTVPYLFQTRRTHHYPSVSARSTDISLC